MDLGELLVHIERKSSAIINIDAIHPAFYASPHLRLTTGQHIHRGAFCAFAKRHGGNTCFDAKERSREAMRTGRPRIGDCPFGIRELAWPVMHDGELAATVYYGAFRGDGWKPRAGDATYDAAPPSTASPATWRALRAEGPFVERFIRTALELWELEGFGPGKHKPAAFYRDVAERFIEQNYQENVQLSDLARALRVTPNFLSHRLRLACGRRFSEILTDKRLAEAAMQLEFHHGRDVTEIAYLCGFRDSNYFSTVFRKRYGVPPRVYRGRFKRP